MESVLDALRALAFREEPAREANQAIDSVRGGFEAGERAFSYEILSTGKESFGALAQAVVPKLVYFAETTGRRLPDCAGLFLSVFVGERIFFVSARAFLDRAARLFESTVAELAQRYGPAGKVPTGPPLMLPGR